MELRKPYPSNVSDDGRAFVEPYLALLQEASQQRTFSLREAFSGLRYLVKTGGQWRWMPHDLPPWPAVYQRAASVGQNGFAQKRGLVSRKQWTLTWGLGQRHGP